jgi:DNA-binding NarL/FixJ family response regulator
MNVSTHRIETQGRLGEAMALLDPQSRRLMELWLDGLTRKEIATELQLCEEAVSTITGTVFKQLRLLLAR